MGDMAGHNLNIEVKTTVPPEISDWSLEALKQFQTTHASIVFWQIIKGLFD
jgi:hypothetical protein